MNRVDVDNGWFIFSEDFYDSPTSFQLFISLINELPWKSGEIKLFGKVHPIPRKQVYFADNKLSYSYSGKKLQIDTWNKTVLAIKDKVESEFKFRFNACLANLYQSGEDSNGWHADNEKELGKNPIIASLSFGTTRRFDLKHMVTNQKISFQLTPGSILIMGGEMQHFWKHQIPKQKKIQGERVNLTFRLVF